MSYHTVTTRKIGYALSLLALLATSACEVNLPITITTNDKRLIVVGELTNDTTVHSIQLFRSGSLISGIKQEVATGATVVVTNRTDTIFFVESTVTPGLYQTSNTCYGIGGNTYRLSVTNVDIDGDGRMDSFSANSTMPKAVKYDSLVSKWGANGDGILAVNNRAYYKITSNGPDYIYNSMTINDTKKILPISKRLGSGEFSRFENFYRINKKDSYQKLFDYYSLEMIPVVKGDNLTFIGYNLTKDEYNFLKEFDSNTSSNLIEDNQYDIMKIPTNLPSNIEPASKSAGYFMAYSISKISKVYQGN